MDIFDVLTMIGGLCLFLFGMNVMGNALERRAGSSLRSLLQKLTGSKTTGFLTGLGVTSVIQSSSATTVMVVGCVNSSLMTLKQAINVIMGANVGTTVTAWILSLGGIDSDVLWLQLLKPTSFTPVLALIGIAFYMFSKSDQKKDTGTILLGFAVLMFGMDTMSDAVGGLADVPAFGQLFLMFRNPVLGVLAGAVLTGIIQSSSASVGILQALAVTGQVSYVAAIPIIMGQNIGTCVTALLSSFGTNKNAKRAAIVHLLFNIMGTVIWLSVYALVDLTVSPALFDQNATMAGIAVAHSLFNIACTAILLPMSGVLEFLAIRLVPDDTKPEQVAELDERLLATPPLALEQCRRLTAEMAGLAAAGLRDGITSLTAYTPELAASIREKENQTDHYEDLLSSYLVKLSAHGISETASAEAAGLLKVIGDFERIADYSVNLLESAEELLEKGISLTAPAQAELTVICNAVEEVLSLASTAFVANDLHAAQQVEPLEQVIDGLKEQLRLRHILRLQKGQCSIVAGFVWSDLLTGLERTSDHCSNVAGCVLDMARNNLNIHQSLRAARTEDPQFAWRFSDYAMKYALPQAE